MNFEFSNRHNRSTHSWNAGQAAHGRGRLNNRYVDPGGLGYKNYNAARFAGRGLNSIAKMTRPLSNTFSLMGRDVTFGRAGMTAGLGLLAARNGANMVDRMRYGDYGGAMMSGALTAAAGYGAYSTWMYKGALRSHFNNAAAWIMKRYR